MTSKTDLELQSIRTEGDVNLSPHRETWQAGHLNAETKRLLAEDAKCFLHQAMSTPCLNALRSASGSWIEDIEGPRYLDFHGNNVHQIGLGHRSVRARARRSRRGVERSGKESNKGLEFMFRL